MIIPASAYGSHLPLNMIETGGVGLSILIHGQSKVGKTTLASTAPGPILVINADGGWDFIRGPGYAPSPSNRFKRVFWNPSLSPTPPVWDGTWNRCEVLITDWYQLPLILQILQSGNHPFRSVVADSASQIQRSLKENIKRVSQSTKLEYAGWASLMDDMSNWVQGMRDLAVGDAALQCVVFIAETGPGKPPDVRLRPLLEGQYAQRFPYSVSVCGYLDATEESRPDGTTVTNQFLYVASGSHPLAITGHRCQESLPRIIRDPNLTTIVNAVATYVNEGS